MATYEVRSYAGCECILTTGGGAEGLLVFVITSGGSDGRHVSVGVQARTIVDNKFDVGSPSAMAPKWGQTGTGKVPCVCACRWVMGGPLSPQRWGPCGAIGSSVEHEHAHGHPDW